MTDAENTKPQEEQPVIPPKPEDAIPDGIGLSLEQVQELLAKTHKKVVDYHDPILMVVTTLNAHLAEVEKLQARHKEGLGRLMADRTDAYVSGVAAAVGQLTDSLSSASVEGIRNVFDDHAARLQAFKNNTAWLAAIVAVSALLNVAVFVLGRIALMLIRPCDDPRLLEGLRPACGPLIMGALEDPGVIEVMLNPDGSLWIERYGQDHDRIGEIPVAQGRLILSQVASGLNLTVNEKSPIVEGEFPLDGSRFEGTFPPIVGPGPSFSLRKKASRVFTLEEYMFSGSITLETVAIIEDAVCRRLNIVVVGGTSSGKTTFVNAVIDAIYRLTPSHRLIILEDTAELQSKSPNTVFMRTSVLAEVDMRKLAKVSMRYAPKRILVGEVRDAAALEMLKL